MEYEAPKERPFAMCYFVSLLPYGRPSGTLSVGFLIHSTIWSCLRHSVGSISFCRIYLLFAFFIPSSIGAILMVENDA